MRLKLAKEPKLAIGRMREREAGKGRKKLDESEGYGDKGSGVRGERRTTRLQRWSSATSCWAVQSLSRSGDLLQKISNHEKKGFKLRGLWYDLYF